MFCFRSLLLFVALSLGQSTLIHAQKTPAELAKVFPEGESNPDVRLGKLRNLRDAYHPWKPADQLDEWKIQSKMIRTQLKLSNGLIPAWPKTPLNAVVHGEIHRGDYIVQRVFFESMPGHYVTGNLYRPVKVEGKVPGVLCPHGHWTDARFYDAGEKAAKKLIADGAEKYMSGARHHIQARMVHLARMGCIVFHYDMVGYSDSKVIDHRNAFNHVNSGLWLINSMGLQTWNSIRAFDFLTSLEHVDQDRIAVTGASGGGTQTFVLAALDDRVDVAFPAVMVSTAMQGGCVCENADYLRLGINNVAIAALFAPKPLAMTGANDWTIEIESKGLPELKQVYSLYDKASNVYAEAHPEFGHNYNYVSRAIMYRWMTEHLNLPDAPLVETDFWPIPKEKLSVFNEEHPLPKNAKSAEELRSWMISQLKEAGRTNLKSARQDVISYRKMMRPVLEVLLDVGLNDIKDVEQHKLQTVTLDPQTKMVSGTLTRKGAQEALPFVWLQPHQQNGQFVLWFDETGKSHLFDEAGNVRGEIRKLLTAGYHVVSADLFLTGEASHPEWGKKMPVNRTYSGYTFGYNKTTIVQRVHDILTVISNFSENQQLHVFGTGDAGLWALLAGTLSDRAVEKMFVNLDGFSFSDIQDTGDPNYLPGALRYGDVGGLGLLATPQELRVGGIDLEGEAAQRLKIRITGNTKQSQSLGINSNNLSRSGLVSLLIEAK